MTGVYGMNVSQITGSNTNPNIWQFFVGVTAINVLMVLAFALTSWVHVKWTHGRTAGLKEIFGSAVGHINIKGGKALAVAGSQ
jgi:hypothetical protein